MPALISELLPNPPGPDRGKEWVELCADGDGAHLGDYALVIGARTVRLSGTLRPGTCAIARDAVSLKNQSPAVALTYHGALIQTVPAAGSAPEGAGWHVSGESGFWATSTPGIPSAPIPILPALPALPQRSSPLELLGTAACVAGILTAVSLAVLRHARNRHNTLRRRDPSPRL